MSFFFGKVIFIRVELIIAIIIAIIKINLHVHFYMMYCTEPDTSENLCENRMTSSGIFLSIKAHKGFWSSTTAT